MLNFLKSLATFVCALFGGLFIMFAIENFISGHYYICGINVMFAIWQALYMAKFVLDKEDWV